MREFAGLGVRTEMTALTRMLGKIHDDITGGTAPVGRGTAYRSGHTAGLRFAGLCVLDQLAATAGSLTVSGPPADEPSERDRIRALAALDRVAARLTGHRRSYSDGEAAAGYRDAIGHAHGVVFEWKEAIGRQQRSLTRQR